MLKRTSSVADPDPGSGAFLTPWIRDEQPGSYFRELRNIFGLKYLNSLMRIREPVWKKFGSGMEKILILVLRSGINIPDPQHRA